MKAAILIIIFAFVATSVLCQQFPSSSQTWTTEDSHQRLINITGILSLKYPVGTITLAINIVAGNGVLSYGIGERMQKYNINGGSMNTYQTRDFYCTFDGTEGKPYFVHFESSVDLLYRVTLTQSSTELPNNESRIVDMTPQIFNGVPFLIDTGSQEANKTISVSIDSGVPIGEYMESAIIRALKKCTAASLQRFPVTSTNTTWTFASQFEAGYEMYIVTFVTRKDPTFFSSFDVVANVELDDENF